MVHRETLYKVDVFVSSGRPFEVCQLRRTIRQVVSLDGSAIQVSSAEDTILAKLELFEMSNRQFDRQWNDIIMMFNVQRHQLDLHYLRTSAEQLSVSALLEKAIAGESPHSPPESSQPRLF
jgi:hypothetical protein